MGILEIKFLGKVEDVSIYNKIISKEFVSEDK